MKELSPIFIVGIPRSGTTLLSNMLNVLDGFFFPDETHFFIQKTRYERHSNYFRKKVTFGEFYFSKRRAYNKKLSIPKDLINQFNLLSSYKEKFEFILTLKGAKNGVLCEKTPIHMDCIEEIKSIYPEARFILIIRDPRDVFSSLLKVEWNFMFPYRKRIELFKKLIRISHLENVSTIKYEDLISNPSQELIRLCDFLKINFDKKMYTDFNNHKYSNFDLKHEPWKANNTKQLDTSNLYKWKKNNNKLCKYVSEKLKNEIDYFGYESNITNIKKRNFIAYYFKEWFNHIFTRVINFDLLLILLNRY